MLWLDEVTRLFARLRQSGSIDLLDHHLSGDGLNITQFPLNRKKHAIICKRLDQRAARQKLGQGEGEDVAVPAAPLAVAGGPA